MKVYLSPSTQERNVTALGSTEEELMHKIADELSMLLKETGMDVLTAKKADSLQQMVRESNLFKPLIHVAIHSNASEDRKARGCEIFHYKGSRNGQRLATSIYRYLETLTPTADRKVKESDALYELKETKAPAVLIEVDFHDNYEGAKWIDANIYNIAVAIGQGICDYLGITLKKNQYRQAIAEIKKIVEAL